MQEQQLKLEVILTQKSKFPKTIPLSTLLGGELQYGCFDGLHLAIGKLDKRGFLAYHLEHIGRGIRVTWNEEERHEIKVLLPLPTSSEEINDFYQLVLRALKSWTCSVVCNGTPVTKNEFKDLKEEMEILNLRCLHTVMKDVLNEEKGDLSFSCAMHRLSVGKKEANLFWAGTTTNAFRDWMHERQEKMAYVAEPEIISGENYERFLGVFTLPTGVPSLFSKQASLPLNYYDLDTGKPKLDIEAWYVRLYDIDQEEIIGYITYPLLMEVLPVEKVHEYDASRYYIDALTRKDLELIYSMSDCKAFHETLF